MHTPSQVLTGDGVSVRAMNETDLPEAAGIFRRAFGTFIGLPDPDSFVADRDFISARWRANPEAAFAAEVAGRLAVPTSPRIGAALLFWGR